MANIHIREIMEYLDRKGFKDALPHQANGEGFFISINFNDPMGKKSGITDDEFVNKVITVDCPCGGVTILFDDEGQLNSIEIC